MCFVGCGRSISSTIIGCCILQLNNHKNWLDYWHLCWTARATSIFLVSLHSHWKLFDSEVSLAGIAAFNTCTTNQRVFERTMRLLFISALSIARRLFVAIHGNTSMRRVWNHTNKHDETRKRILTWNSSIWNTLAWQSIVLAYCHCSPSCCFCLCLDSTIHSRYSFIHSPTLIILLSYTLPSPLSFFNIFVACSHYPSFFVTLTTVLAHLSQHHEHSFEQQDEQHLRSRHVVNESQHFYIITIDGRGRP